MVMSFVIAMSLAMLGLLRTLAELGAEQSALEAELDRRQRADQIALDCTYIAARALAVLGTIDEMKDRRIPVGEGFCMIRNGDSGTVQDDDNQEYESLIVRVELDSAAPETAGGVSSIQAEIAASAGRINLIKI